MKSILEKLQETNELKPIECDWCCGSDLPLYKFEDRAVCEKCLASESYEEPERGLTVDERNK